VCVCVFENTGLSSGMNILLCLNGMRWLTQFDDPQNAVCINVMKDKINNSRKKKKLCVRQNGCILVQYIVMDGDAS